MIEGDGGLNLHPPAIQASNGTEVDHIPKERKDVSFLYSSKRSLYFFSIVVILVILTVTVSQ